MKKQFCPLCGPKTPNKVIYQQNFRSDQINKKVFSARRRPDRLHYKMVKCLGCGLVYADSILEPKKINQLYCKSLFTYESRVDDLSRTYGYYLEKLEGFQVNKDRLLEVGCGNGFLLLKAKEQGYKEVWGVEPSLEAVNKAVEDIKQRIKNTVFKKSLFPKYFFDVICFMQTFDHIYNPNKFLQDCCYLLKPGGLILAINHNVDAFQAKILKERSPIIDVEHPFLYSMKTMSLIFKKNKFEVLKLEPIFNIYSINYLFLKLKLKLGNLMIIARS